MPAFSLVVCVANQIELLRRLLVETRSLCHDLVVVQDGPESDQILKEIEQLVAEYNGRFFVRPREFQQEPHWPFAWGEARTDWILRLDADEIPSAELKQWLEDFRNKPEPDENVSGYTCCWPLWDGAKIVTKCWPSGRIFLFHKQRVRFFGMVEQVPVPDRHFEALPLVLEHRPRRKSYGVRNILFRRQAYHWRRVIAQSLLGSPSQLPCWRWTSSQWPPVWQEIRDRPLTTAVQRLIKWPVLATRDLWRAERRFIPSASVSGGIHHCLIALEYWRRRKFLSS